MLSEQASGPAVEQRAPQSPGRSGDHDLARVPYDPGLQWRDVETETDPLALADGLKNIAAGVREFFEHFDGGKGGWRFAVMDEGRRAQLLNQLAYAGAFLARISLVIDETAREIEEMREIHEQTMAEVRTQKKKAAS